MKRINLKMFFGILVTALVLVAMMTPVQAATWDSTLVYWNTTGILYDIAVGDKIKGASDDTVRIFATRSSTPYEVLLFTDISSALPLSWRTDVVFNETGATRGKAIGDVDRDGDNDLVYVRTATPYQVRRVRWTGSAWVMDTLATLTASSANYDIAIGDVDNDGYADDIIAGNSYHAFRIRWNGASWDTTRIFNGTSTTGTVYGLAVGNFDAAYAGNEIAMSTYGQKVFRIRWTGAAWDSLTLYTHPSDFDFYDCAVGDFDASNPGDEIAINNGYPSASAGVYEIYGSGTSWTFQALYVPGSGWSSSGEIAVGDFFTTNPGAEIVACGGGSSPYRTSLVYGSGATWYNEQIMTAAGSAYGVAVGNLNRHRPGNEVATSAYYKIWEAEQKLLTYDMQALSIDDVPSMAETDEIITIKATVRNNAEYTANAPIPVKFRIDGPLGYVYTDVDQATSLNLAPGGTEQIIFTPDWFVPDTLCSYTIKVWTELAGDEVPANDTVTKIVTVIRVGGLVESFTGTTFPPAGWTVYNLPNPPDTVTSDRWSRYTTYYNTAPACARIYYDPHNNDWLITPRLKAVDGDKLKFWWRAQSTSENETLYVKVSTDPDVSNTGAYGVVYSDTTRATTWQQEVVDLSSYAGQDIFIAFHYDNYDNYGVAIDNVTGPYFPPQIATSPDSIYAESFPDSFFDVFFNIGNIGGGTLNYTVSLAGSSSWATVHPTSGALSSGGQEEDTVSINTTGLDGHYYDTLVITSNSGEKATSYIPIHIWVRLIPDITVSPDSLAVGVEANGTKDTAMFISNSGNGLLEYTIDTEEWMKVGAVYYGEPASGVHGIEPGDEEVHPEKDWVDNRRGTTPTKGQGGPDLFGYRWIDSDEPGGPVFSWIEINSIGTEVLPTDDGNVGPYAIGFPFEFYGVTFDSFRIASNGFATFTSTSGTLTNATIPTTGQPNNLLALNWDDLRAASGGGAGHIFYHSDGSKLVIEWDHVMRYAHPECPYTMQIILYPNGKIIYQYLTMGEASCTTYHAQSTIGIENGDGTDGLEVLFNAYGYMHDNLAIRFSSAPSWLVFDPEFGTVPTSGTDTIDITYDATGILGGEFYGAFIVTSNDPDTPVDTVPAHMHVLSPDMTFSPDSIMTTATEGQAPFDLTMDVGNAGDGQLIFSITEGMPWLSVAPSTDTIPTGDPASTVTLTINASSLYAGHYHGELKVYSNDPDLQPYATYQVYLTVGPDPDIAVTPDSFYVGIYAGYTKDTVMIIANTGDGHLTWGIGIEEIGKGGDTTLYEGFESGTFPPTDWVVVNNDGGTQTWTDYTTYYHTGTHSTSCRWETTTLWNDDWLITPRISIGSNDTLSFWYRAYSATWPESLEVRLSTTTNDVSAFTHLLWAGSQITNSTWEEMKIELGSKFARGQVYIAFVYKGLYQFRIYLDDICVRSYAGPWLTLNPSSGVIDPGSSENVGVRFSAVGVEDDMYANLWIFSNDPDENPIVMPVHMAVLGPNYSVSPPETLVIDALEAQYTDGHVFMQNYSGHAPLAYKITDEVDWLSETPDTAEVPIDGAQDVTVTVDGNLLIAGDYATKLYISTNDFDIPKDTLVVIVHMGPPPDISVSPESLRVVVAGGTTSDATLTINNTGDGHLAFDITTEETGPKAVSGNNNRYSEILESHRSLRLMQSNIPVDQNDPSQLSGVGTGEKPFAAPGAPLKFGGDTVYVQWPHSPSDSWSMGTSDAGAGYKIYENFWGVTLPIKEVQFWGLCLKYSAGWIAGNPNNLVFNITFYSDPASDPTMPPNQVACTYTSVVPPVIINTGLLFNGFPMYLFGGIELSPLCTLDEGWVSIQSQSAGSGYDWLLWASALSNPAAGDSFSYQQGSTTPNTIYDRGLLMLGGANWLTVTPEADTVDPQSSTNVNVHFDATNILGGDKYANILIASNDPDESPLTVRAHMIVAGANYSVHPLELDINALEDQITPANLLVSNPGGIGTLSFKMTWNAPWLTAIPDTADVPPDGSQNVTVRIDGNMLIAGEYYTEIFVKTNAANQQYDTIPVYVHVGPNPEIDLSQTSFNVRMNPGVNLDVPLRVNNLGSGHLSFETEIESVKPEGKADVLLVDDDGSAWVTFTDVRSYFTNALTANGYTYDVFEVMTQGADGPSAATMAGYGAVIWFTGECWQLSQTLTVNDEANLGAYLDGGGNLFLSAMDYFYDRYLSAGSFSPGQFPYDYLHVSYVSQDVWTIVNPATGSCVGIAGSLTDGMSFSLWDPYTAKGPYGKGVDDGLYIDELTHSGMNLFQMTNPTPTGIAALQYASPKGYKVVFTTVDFAGLTDGAAPSTKNELMKRIMEWFAGGGPVTCPFTVNPEADTLEPTSFEDLILSFDGSAFEACSEETLYCNLIFTTNDPDELMITVPVTVWAGRGDVFAPSGLLDIGDVIFLLNYILKGGPAPDPICMGDLALPHDGMVDMSDMIYLQLYLFSEGPQPVVTPAVTPTPMQR